MGLRQHRRNKLTKKNEGPERFRVFVARQWIGWWNDPRRGKRLGMQVRPGFVSSRDVDWSLGRSLGREPDRSVGWSAGQAADRKADRLQRGGRCSQKWRRISQFRNTPPRSKYSNLRTAKTKARNCSGPSSHNCLKLFGLRGIGVPRALSDGISAVPARSADLPCASCASCGGRERSDHRLPAGAGLLAVRSIDCRHGAESCGPGGGSKLGLRTSQS